ncbi:MAG: 4-carboxymuconolactone decarboxylase [Roseitalea sp.]|uniref:4-carboxymuconolactone decarboxylase n=1 Tax=Oceaniradius stylonematis TaxID=2184161 RepID=A0A3A8A5U1_9HYPH|nr:4-carboxymuconolactone decarboxylase [Oceaniradius stylonematis]MBO6552696.1 4-carboxymuconolactone decarboxylase [Roseitalea sp.]MBO6950383.1 4-carboxymuconolactone decarboxylase [Rhizobiaceae bacterium]RNC95284.1 MAG: 4-carboxymuconolactone decarboxylase [Oricola sp.]MBO6591628.1 4-carboxymuconolactone decarboxylase [Roseitalea sp.]MBO6599483.1 4-carboxymuconolactone decarboxylase [Roseitalea sp.]
MSDRMDTDRLQNGMKMRRRVLGDDHVDRAEAEKTEFDAPFQTMITETAWGNLWARDTISLRERSILTLALLAATGNFDEIAMHVRACKRTGASKADVMEAFMHVAVYAGVPRANRAIKIAKETYRAMEQEETVT